jgi:urease accessory protein
MPNNGRTELKTNSNLTSSILCGMTLFILTGPALAHSETGAASGFLSGFLHPVLGLDHVIAMLAVGLWGAFLRAPAIWLLPIVFPLVMAFGGALGVAQIDLPAVEIGIALSAVILGLCVAFAFKPPLWVAAIIVGAFAIFHGHAHGTEMPHAADAISYGLGFVIATGLLHLCGIAVGALARWPAGTVLVRGAGGLIAMAGGAVLSGMI